MLRVEVDNVAATLELDSEAWTPELVETFLRMCGDEVVRTGMALGMEISDEAEDDDTSSGVG
jgi:hypothetical protein